VENLPLTGNVRAQLVAAGARFNSLSPRDYNGLQPGKSYYAYDPATSSYWAGAALAPKPSSLRAEVASQDDGAYLVFHRPAGGSWVVTAVGLAGVGGTTCGVTVPASVLAVWGWPAGTCRPPSI
jgi:hypothetical protein